jgi:hypothetical protein
MSDKNWALAFRGGIAEGYRVEQVADNLRTLFRLSPQHVDSLLKKRNVVLKQSSSRAALEKYRSVLERAGLICDIEWRPRAEGAADSESLPAAQASREKGSAECGGAPGIGASSSDGVIFEADLFLESYGDQAVGHGSLKVTADELIFEPRQKRFMRLLLTTPPVKLPLASVKTAVGGCTADATGFVEVYLAQPGGDAKIRFTRELAGIQSAPLDTSWESELAQIATVIKWSARAARERQADGGEQRPSSGAPGASTQAGALWNAADDPVAVLKMRLARGEITLEDFRALRAQL